MVHQLFPAIAENVMAEGSGGFSLPQHQLKTTHGGHRFGRDPHLCSVKVCRLPEDIQSGPLADVGPELFEHHPFRDHETFELEPQTESTLRAHFVLPVGPVYLFRWYLKTVPDWSGKSSEWRKETVWNSSPESIRPTTT